MDNQRPGCLSGYQISVTLQNVKKIALSRIKNKDFTSNKLILWLIIKNISVGSLNGN